MKISLGAFFKLWGSFKRVHWNLTCRSDQLTHLFLFYYNFFFFEFSLSLFFSLSLYGGVYNSHQVYRLPFPLLFLLSRHTFFFFASLQASCSEDHEGSMQMADLFPTPAKIIRSKGPRYDQGTTSRLSGGSQIIPCKVPVPDARVSSKAEEPSLAG